MLTNCFIDQTLEEANMEDSEESPDTEEGSSDSDFVPTLPTGRAYQRITTTLLTPEACVRADRMQVSVRGQSTIHSLDALAYNDPQSQVGKSATHNKRSSIRYRIKPLFDSIDC